MNKIKMIVALLGCEVLIIIEINTHKLIFDIKNIPQSDIALHFIE